MNGRPVVGDTIGFELLEAWHTGVVVDQDSHGVAVRYWGRDHARRTMWLSWAAVQRRSVTAK